MKDQLSQERNGKRLDSPDSPADLLKCGQCTVHCRLVQGSGNLCAQAGLAFRHDGIPKSFDVHTFVEQRVTHLHGHGCFAQHDGHDGVIAFQNPEAQLADVFSEILGISVKLFDEAWVLLQHREGFDRRGDNRGGQ